MSLKTESDKNQKCICLSVALELCLLLMSVVVVCTMPQPPDLIYRHKIPYFTQNHHGVSRIFYFIGQAGNIGLFLKIISHKWTAFVFGNTYYHQIFTECGFNQCTYFDVLTCQMWLQVIERSLIMLSFFLFFHRLNIQSIHKFWHVFV